MTRATSDYAQRHGSASELVPAPRPADEKWSARAPVTRGGERGRLGGLLREGFRRGTAALRALPDFVIIGAQKAGTSSLYSYLTQHPDVIAATRKEIHYFGAPAYEGGLGWYRAHFPLSGSLRYLQAVRGRSVLTGEASPYYLFHPHSHRRMRAVIPDAKIIVMLRNPINRALSHYQHQVRKGWEPLSFTAAIDTENARLEGELDRMLADERYYGYNYWAYSYQARGVYWEQLERWLSVYPREQFLFLSSEEFFADPASAYTRTQSFLGLKSHELRDYGKQNSGGSYSGLEDGTEAQLSAHFKKVCAELRHRSVFQP